MRYAKLAIVLTASFVLLSGCIRVATGNTAQETLDPIYTEQAAIAGTATAAASQGITLVTSAPAGATTAAGASATPIAVASVTPAATDTPPPPDVTPGPTFPPAPTLPSPTAGGQAVAPAPASADATYCDKAAFIADVTVPDGSDFAPNASFTKTWRLRNAGTCTWTTAYDLVFVSGSQMGAASAYDFTTSVPPGATVDLSANMVAPGSAGRYQGYWGLRNGSGQLFGLGTSANQPFWVLIDVVTGTTPVPGTGFDFAAQMCSATWSSGAGSLACPGTTGNAAGYEIQATNPVLESGTTFTGNGMLTVPQNVPSGYIMGVYPAYTVQSGDRFKSIVNCQSGATGCDVFFQLQYQIGSGPITTFWQFHERYEGLYYTANVDLSSLAGQSVKFILRVANSASTTNGLALWAGPRIEQGGTTPPTPPPSGCTNLAAFIADVNVPDGTVFAPNTAFTKTWRLKNVGTCTWTTSYKLTWVSGDPLGAVYPVAFPASVVPGATVDLSANMAAPSANGTYQGNWMLQTPSGTNFGIGSSGTGVFWVRIQVSGGSGATATPTTPPSGCTDRATFIADVTVPDGTVFAPNTAFTKTWRLKNNGTCTWTTGYKLTWVSGDPMSAVYPVSLTSSVAPGATVDVSANMVSPGANGTYQGNWMMQNASGVNFGLGSSGTGVFWVRIVVSGGSGPTPTPPPPSSCTDKAQFIADVTVPDGTSFPPDTAFTKTWRLKNIGTCTWTTAYDLVFVSGSQMSAPSSVPFTASVPPGATVDLSANMISPSAPGTYQGNWMLQNASGVNFGLGISATGVFWVRIQVSPVGGTATPTPIPTNTPTPGPSPTPSASADLYVTITDGSTSYTAGNYITYTVVVGNNSGNNVTGASFSLNPTSQTSGYSVTCVAGAGASCNPGPVSLASGVIFTDTVTIPVAGQVTYSASVYIPYNVTATITSTANVSPPAGVSDPNLANNTASDTDTPLPVADVLITGSVSSPTYTPGGTLTYTYLVQNAGPSNAAAAVFTSSVTAQVTSWTINCVAVGGATCTASAAPVGLTYSDTVTIPPGATLQYTITVQISLSATGSVTNTSTISAPAGTTDPNVGNNSLSFTSNPP
jgi:uncharacterized repeat protein (TIGR01451 family)